MKRGLYILLLFFCQFLRGLASEPYKAQVRDAQTGDALSFVSVYAGENKGAITNAEGVFRLNVGDEVPIKISYIGYKPITLLAGQRPKQIKLEPVSTDMQEVTVIPANNVMKKLSKKLQKEYNKHKRKEGFYLFRTVVTYPDRKEIAEALTEASSAINIRDIVVINGRHGQLRENRLFPPHIDNANLHHLTELGPMINDNLYWIMLATPIETKERQYQQPNYYSYTMHPVYNSDNKETYQINVRKERKTVGGILTGSMIVDIKKLQLLRFDGEIEGLKLELEKDFRTIQIPVKTSVHLDFSNDKGYTEVSTVSVTLTSDDMTCQTVLQNIDDRHPVLPLGISVKNDILATIDYVGYDASLWEGLTAPLARTQKEETLFEAIGKENKSEDRKQEDTKLKPYVDRLKAFGETIPQEKVFVHMDNTCYFLGDTIWFSAYTRQSTDDKPSHVSGVLYVELLNNEGYLVERKMIEMREGRGNGFFALNKNIQYAGFYELRAYTRWQLNWGVFEHPHSKFASTWFVNRILEQEYYRDYEKLYSRFFPVYDKPLDAEDDSRTMSLRPKRRKYDPPKRELTIKCYPEGGALVVGTKCKMAFEAQWNDGEWADGVLHIGNTTASTQNRGRGIIEFIPNESTPKEAVFTAKDAKEVKTKLPKTEKDAVRLSALHRAKQWDINIEACGKLQNDTLGLTIMHEGRLEYFTPFCGRFQMSLDETDKAQPGIHQITVFDADGHIHAERLVFVKPQVGKNENIHIQAAKQQYSPHEKVELKLSAQPGEGKKKEAIISLSVKDAALSDAVYDNGNILTEILLASEVRGYIPNPEWYFESDDEEHRQALDLLMLTQGWRRYNWRDMAVRGAWDLTQPDEQTPVIDGRVMDINLEQIRWEQNHGYEEEPDTGKQIILPSSRSSDRFTIHNPSGKLKRDVLVHSELIPFSTLKPTVKEMRTKDGRFRLTMPHIYGKYELFISASDTMRWGQEGPYLWIQSKDSDPTKTGPKYIAPAEFYIQVLQPYPRFVNPYTFYQNHLQEKKRDVIFMEQADSTTLMEEVTVTSSRKGLRRFSDASPAFMVDSYTWYNDNHDAGMLLADNDIARMYVGDYGLSSPFVSGNNMITKRYGLSPHRRGLPQYIDIPKDSIYYPKYLKSFDKSALLQFGFIHSEGEYYNELCKIDKYFIYTDYEPRREGDKAYEGTNMPETYVVLYPYPDGSRYMIYRDRCLYLSGFAEPADFYHPDYSKHRLPEGQKDYRRTLYWNPNLKLDKNGEATVTFYNNSRTTHLSIEAEGQAVDGTLLWGKNE